MENKLISLPTKNPTPDHIVDLVKSPLRSECYDSIFWNYEKMVVSKTFRAQFLRSLLPPDTKILRPRISLRVKKTDIENQYDLYSRTCSDGSSILEGVEFTVSYAPMHGICPLCIIIATACEKGLINFALDISNAFQNTIYPTLHKESISSYHIYIWIGTKYNVQYIH